MEFYTLASGSSGNCSLVCAGDTLLLIDAGIARWGARSAT